MTSRCDSTCADRDVFDDAVEGEHLVVEREVGLAEDDVRPALVGRERLGVEHNEGRDDLRDRGDRQGVSGARGREHARVSDRPDRGGAVSGQAQGRFGHRRGRVGLDRGIHGLQRCEEGQRQVERGRERERRAAEHGDAAAPVDLTTGRGACHRNRLIEPGFAHAQRPERDRGRRSDVERVHAVQHRDGDDRVRDAERRGTEAVALGAEYDRDALRGASRRTRRARRRRRRGRGRRCGSRPRAVRPRPPATPASRVHGTCSTVPMLTRTLRR